MLYEPTKPTMIDQMAMLERMVDPNAPASAAGFAAAAGKRQKRAVGNGRGSGGGDVGGITDARNLLKRLERKVREREEGN